MQSVLACLLVAAAVVQLASANARVQDVIRMLQQPRELERMNHNGAQDLASRVSAFSWSNCGSASDPIQVKNLTLTPDPLKLPGNITVGFGVAVGVPLKAPVEVSLELKKKIGFWVRIPCVDNVGSCDYPDLCAMLQNVTCPPEFAKYHIPCRCPVAQGSYYLPRATTFVKLPSQVPSWLDDGDYQVTATMKAAGKELACVHVNLSISKA